MRLVGSAVILATVASLGLLAAACESADSAGASAPLRVTMRADFGEEVARGGLAVLRGALETACPASVLQDNPSFAAGLDCDGDGAPVAYLTPSAYRVAFKRLTFVHQDLGPVDVVSDTGRLADAEVFDISQAVVVADLVAPTGRYVRMEAELYYFELVLTDGPAPRTVRVYLSDDDFPEEGSLGHHQGDITLVSGEGEELGFVQPAQPWTVDALLAERGETQGGGGVDAETGHARGLFGDAGLWNRGEFSQGAGRDVYLLLQDIAAELDAGGATAAVVFEVANSWFFEDFGANGAFNPCDIEACDIGAAWGPLFYPPSLSVE